jgi:hypothetical protein
MVRNSRQIQGITDCLTILCDQNIVSSHEYNPITENECSKKFLGGVGGMISAHHRTEMYICVLCYALFACCDKINA